MNKTVSLSKTKKTQTIKILQGAKELGKPNKKKNFFFVKLRIKKNLQPLDISFQFI